MIGKKGRRGKWSEGFRSSKLAGDGDGDGTTRLLERQGNGKLDHEGQVSKGEGFEFKLP